MVSVSQLKLRNDFLNMEPTTDLSIRGASIISNSFPLNVTLIRAFPDMNRLTYLFMASFSAHSKVFQVATARISTLTQPHVAVRNKCAHTLGRKMLLLLVKNRFHDSYKLILC
jgi:hypothetical protein